MMTSKDLDETLIFIMGLCPLLVYMRQILDYIRLLCMFGVGLVAERGDILSDKDLLHGLTSISVPV